MVPEFGFLDPYTVYYIIGVIPIIILLWYAYVSRAEVTRTLLGASQSESPWRAVCLLFTPLLLLALALGRPYLGHEKVEVPVPGIDYMFVVDISQSMLARDIPPSRIAVAKRKMLDTIQEFRRRGGGSRFGITLFAGSAYLFCPITADYSVLKQFIDTISPGLVTSRGSNIAAGIEVALERLKSIRSKSGRLLVLSDGEDLNPLYDGVIATLNEQKVPLDALGFGSLDGSPIEVRTGIFLKDSRGETILSRLQEDLLKRLSSESGGVYVHSTVGDSDVRTIAESALRRFSTGNSVVTYIDQYGEVGPWLALLGGTILIILSFIRRCGLSLMVTLPVTFLVGTLPFSVAPALCEEPSTTNDATNDPYELYNGGRYPEAISAYRERLRFHPTDPTLKKGLAASLYHNGDFMDAAKIYGELADTTTKGHEFFENKYNQANSLLKGRKFSDAVEAYEKALQSKPHDSKALHNRQVARALLEAKKREEEKKQESQNREKKHDEDNNSDKNNAEKNNSEQPEPNDQQQAERIDGSKGESLGSAPRQDGSEAIPNQDEDPPLSSSTPQPREGEAFEEKKEAAGTPEPREESSKESIAESERVPKREPPSLSTDPDRETVPPSSADENNQARPQDPQESQSAFGKESTEGTATAPANSQASQLREAEKDIPPTEAEMWIESLPDAPLLLRRHGGPPPASGQTW